MSPLQQAAGYPHLSDYLDDTGKVFTVSPKGYAAWGLSGPGSANTSTITFGSKTCPVPASNPPATTRHRAPTGWNVPAYFSADCGSPLGGGPRHGRTTPSSTRRSSTRATDNRYVVGHDPAHQGGDIWADRRRPRDHGAGGRRLERHLRQPARRRQGRAHVGRRQRPEGATPGYDPMTHMEYAAETADAQVGRIMQALEDSGELDNTLVVLTADHGSVAADEGHFHGDFEPVNDYGYFNWYYGSPERRAVPEPAGGAAAAHRRHRRRHREDQRRLLLQRLLAQRVAEGPVAGEGRRGGGHHGGPRRTSPPSGSATATTSTGSPRCAGTGCTAPRSGGSPRKAQELVDTQAADYGPDLIATLPDNTTYSVARRPRRHPARVAADPDRLRRRRPVAQGPARGGEVGRHHADDPAGHGDRADPPDGRDRLRAADPEARPPLDVPGGTAARSRYAARSLPSGVGPPRPAPSG